MDVILYFCKRKYYRTFFWELSLTLFGPLCIYLYIYVIVCLIFFDDVLKFANYCKFVIVIIIIIILKVVVWYLLLLLLLFCWYSSRILFVCLFFLFNQSNRKKEQRIKKIIIILIIIRLHFFIFANRLKNTI